MEIRTTICGIGIFIPKELRDAFMEHHGDDVINEVPRFLREFKRGGLFAAQIQWKERNEKDQEKEAGAKLYGKEITTC